MSRFPKREEVSDVQEERGQLFYLDVERERRKKKPFQTTPRPPASATPVMPTQTRAKELRRNWPNFGPFLLGIADDHVKDGRLSEEDAQRFVMVVKGLIESAALNLSDPVPGRVAEIKTEFAKNGVVAMRNSLRESRLVDYAKAFRKPAMTALKPEGMDPEIFEKSVVWCVVYEPALVALYRTVEDQIKAEHGRRKTPVPAAYDKK